MDNGPMNPEPQAPQTPQEPQAPQGDGNEKLMFALIYAAFGIVALIFLFVKKGDKEYRYHSLNSLFFWVAEFVVMTTLGIILSFIPFIGWVLAFLLPLVSLACWGYMIYLGYLAYQGQKPVIPFLTEFMEKTTATWNI